jgi:hypothetical protein
MRKVVLIFVTMFIGAVAAADAQRTKQEVFKHGEKALLAKKISSYTPSLKAVLIEDLSQVAQHQILKSYDTAYMSAILVDGQRNIILIFKENEVETLHILDRFGKPLNANVTH